MQVQGEATVGLMENNTIINKKSYENKSCLAYWTVALPCISSTSIDGLFTLWMVSFKAQKVFNLMKPDLSSFVIVLGFFFF